MRRPGGRPLPIRLATLSLAMAVTVSVGLVFPRLGAGHQDLDAGQLSRIAKPGGLGQWAFIEKQGARPVAYDPCRTIHYTIRVGNGPLNGTSLVQEGIDRLRAATGLTFVFDGMSNEVPQWDYAPKATTPVWIGWADETETDIWDHGADWAGVAQSRAVMNPQGRQVYVTGHVVLKPDNGLPPSFAAGATEGTVLLHELGHLVGLDHVADEGETMHSGVSTRSPSGFGPGDRRGLWELGSSQGCG